jgi:hypothetical protein
MVFSLNFEELTALRQGVQALRGSSAPYPFVPSLAGHHEEGVEVLEGIDGVEDLLLTGSQALSTFGEQRRLEAGIRSVVSHLHGAMNREVVATHPADEGAVAAYFDYAHALSALHRIEAVGAEMRALFELIEGREPAEAEFESFVFPD